MILYRDSRASQRTNPPAWLEGAVNLQRRDADSDGVRWWGIGEGYRCGDQPSAQWNDLGEGWSFAVLSDLVPQALARNQSWCRTRPVADLKGRVWQAPCLLTLDGRRAFNVSYGGDDFLPVLTQEQHEIEAIARVAAEALINCHESGTELDMRAACAWASRMLALVNHVSPKALARGGLLDDGLVMTTLYAATAMAPGGGDGK